MKIYPGKMRRKRVLLGFLLGLSLFSVTARAESDKDVEELLACSLRIARDLEKPFDKTAALVYIALNYSDIGQKEKASKILSQAFRSAMKEKDASNRYTMLAYVAGKYAKIGEYDKALQVTRRITRNEYHKNNALGEIGVECADAGKFDLALKIAEIIKEDRNRASVLEKVARGYEKIGKTNEALQINKTVEYLRRNVVSSSSRKAYVSLDEGKYDEAIQMANTMDNGRVKSSLLAEIAVRYFKSGQKEKCLELLSQAVQVAGPDPWGHKEWTLADIALKYAEIGEYDKAIKLAQTLKDVGDRDRALSDISREYARDGEYEKAVQVVKTIEEPLTRSMTLFWIAQEHVRAGQYSQAVQVVRTIEDSWQKSFGLSYIAEEYYKKGEIDKASEVLCEALEVAMATENPHFKAMLLTEIAGKYAKTGLKMDDKAKNILNEIKKKTK